MGRLKPLLPYGGMLVIQQVVRSLAASPASRVLVVLGHRADEIAAALDNLPAEPVMNPGYAGGMLTSIQAGLAAAPPSAWYGVALADQPWIGPAVVAQLLERAESAGTGAIAVPSYRGRRGHPLLFCGSYRQELLDLPPHLGLRELLRRHADRVEYLEMEDASLLTDMDTPADYEEALLRLAATDCSCSA